MVAIASLPEFVAAPRRRPGPRVERDRAPLRAVAERRPAAVVRVEGAGRPLLAMVMAVVAFLGVAGLVMTEPLAEPGTVAVSDTTHQVAEGETMWSIALEIAPAGQAATYVERLVEVNGGATVVPGQVLVLPQR